MNKLKLAIGFVTTAMLMSATAIAGTWSSQVLLDAIELDGTAATPATFVGFATTPSGKPSCGNGTGWAHLYGSADSVKAMTSVVNSAFLADRNVEVYWEGTCTNSTYARIAAVRMR